MLRVHALLICREKIGYVCFNMTFLPQIEETKINLFYYLLYPLRAMSIYVYLAALLQKHCNNSNTY